MVETRRTASRIEIRHLIPCLERAITRRIVTCSTGESWWVEYGNAEWRRVVVLLDFDGALRNLVRVSMTQRPTFTFGVLHCDS